VRLQAATLKPNNKPWQFVQLPLVENKRLLSGLVEEDCLVLGGACGLIVAATFFPRDYLIVLELLWHVPPCAHEIVVDINQIHFVLVIG